MPKLTSSFLVPTSGSSVQLEPIGVAAAAGFQDFRCRNLTTTGTATFGSTATASTVFQAANGSSGTPSYGFTTQTGTGLYLVAANVVGLNAAFEFISNAVVGVSSATTGRIRYNNATSAFECSINGAGYSAFATVGGAVLNGITNTTAGVLAWNSGSGVINQLAGPSDQSFSIISGSGRTLSLGATGAATINLATNSTTRASIDSSGNLLVGDQTVSGGVTGVLHVVSNSTAPFRIYMSNASNAPTNVSLRTRGTASSPTGAQSGDNCGGWYGQAYNGSGTIPAGSNNCCSIDFICDGAQTGTSSPGRMLFSTTPSASVTLVERWRIDNTGAMYGMSAGSIHTWTTGLGAISHLTGPTDQPLKLASANNQNVFLSPNGSGVVSMDKKIGIYNNVTTAGWGVPAIYSSGRVTAQTGAATIINAFAVPAADSTYEICFNVLATTSTTYSFNVRVSYTDESNTARTLDLFYGNATSGQPTNNVLTQVEGPVFNGLAMKVRCKASTTITVATAGTFTTVTYNAEATIIQIA